MLKLIFASILGVVTFFYMSVSGKTDYHDPAHQAGKPLFSFGLIADVQYCSCEAEGSRYYRNSLSKLRDAMNSLREDSVDFIFNMGDLIDHNFESFKPVLNIIDSSGIKVYHLSGNHDYSVDNRYKHRLPIHQPSQEGYYSFVFKNFRFIALNGNEMSIYAGNNKTMIQQAEDYIVNLKNEGAVNAIEWNGGISTKQLAWLKSELDDAVLKGEKVFILCHFPVFPESIYNLLNYNDVLHLLKNYDNIIAWFNGHNHAGNYDNFNSIHFLTMKGMVETENTGSYSVVEVYSNKIWINGYGKEKSQILAY
jgi:manganese-dependent ADP-ribose/CDP-alcohol diphosphatase